MMAHIYRTGDVNGLHISTNRITMFEDGLHRFNIAGRVLVLGTAENKRNYPRTTDINSIMENMDYSKLNVMPMSAIAWFWVEED